ncbi:MaoC/PaaZ C-terminal domain-containing protein [Microbacterium sp. A94]|uniref:MaoC/PaaZ C-terminal domain-containing protein n=1 Tax=Microbacterium sp. A94 TaxID=3450717 RepID=UPI003F438536
MELTTLADIQIGVPLSIEGSVSWTSRDALLYALAIGAGQRDPAAELAFTTDNTASNQRVLPTFGAILSGRLGMEAVLSAIGGIVDTTKMLHGDQSYVQFQELQPEGSLTAVTSITGVWDKGSAAVVEIDTEFADTAGTVLGRGARSLFFRGAGGWGGDRGPSADKAPSSDGRPDLTIQVPTRPDQPLLYRLTGDNNPIHTDPEAAKNAGFSRPIMHGMCHYGMIGRVLLNELAGGDPARFVSLSTRFSRPVMPGDQLTLDVWAQSNGRARFTVTDPAGEKVQTGGVFEFAGI